MSDLPPFNTESQPRSARALISPAFVRRQAVWAGVAASLMLFYGYTSIFSDFAAGQILRYTLQIGGVVMAIITLLLMTGEPRVLAVDGVVSMVIGGCLAVSGVLMFLAAGEFRMNAALQLVFGYMFVSSGWRDLRYYQQMSQVDGSDPIEP